MRKLISLIIYTGVLAGCASVAPEDFVYGPPSGTTDSRDRTLDQCWANANLLPITAAAATNPFLVAAMEQNYVVQCMAAQGWRSQ